MRSRHPASVILAVLAFAVPAGVRGQTAAPGSPMQDALAAYLRDPAANAKALLDTAHQQGGALDPMSAFFLGDAAVRTGRYRTATEYFAMVGDAPGYASAAELGLAWAALGRGRLTEAYQHLETVGATSPALRPLTDLVLALVGAASGSPDAYATLAELGGRADADPAFREVAPLLDAYARYWSGDTAGAADAFTAFAVANPDSRFADDALYAAAQAKQRLGRDAEAQADLEALAGDDRARGRLSSRLVALDGRALLREGMRRDRALGTRPLPQRVADLFDGDGGRLARAALVARAGARDAQEPAAGPHDGPARARDGRSVATAGATPDAVRASGASRSGPAVQSVEPAGPAAAPEGGLLPRVGRFPWTVGLALSAGLLLLALWLLGRGRAPSARR